MDTGKFTSVLMESSKAMGDLYAYVNSNCVLLVRSQTALVLWLETVIQFCIRFDRSCELSDSLLNIAE